MKRIFTPVFCVVLASAVVASASDALFDVEARREALQTPEYASAREACLASKIELPEEIPAPVKGLHTTEGYGGDNTPEPYVWQVEVLGGRALAGDKAAAEKLREAIWTWAQSGAYTKSDVAHDTFYEIKRYMMPVIVNYGIVRDSFSEKQQSVIEAWIDKVVRPLDKKFGGDVDLNNHRTLADSILMLWGAVKGDDALYNIGIEGFKHVLREARPDGSLPLETRRGQRATWYMRHALASMALMAEIAARKGDDLYALRENGVGMDTIVNAFVTAVYAPVSILPDAAQNHIPGPHRDYIFQDDAYLRVRGHGRHYMAFAEMLVRHPSFATTRLEALLNKTSFRERPLIDEYIGGNATCFFWEPK